MALRLDCHNQSVRQTEKAPDIFAHVKYENERKGLKASELHSVWESPILKIKKQRNPSIPSFKMDKPQQCNIIKCYSKIKVD